MEKRLLASQDLRIYYLSRSCVKKGDERIFLPEAEERRLKNPKSYSFIAVIKREI